MDKTYHNRRYKLHGKVKRFARMNARGRCVYLPEVLNDRLTDRQRKVIKELRDKFKYNIQMVIE